MLPTMFIGHGGGPLPLLQHPSHEDLLRTWAAQGPVHSVVHDPAVRAIVVVSAHHETPEGTVDVMMDARPRLLFDYSGFPPETYRYTMDNPGSPEVALRVLELLGAAGIPAQQQSGRGHDHGVFVPLLGLGVAAARPALPVISVSLRGPGVRRAGLTEEHFAMGRALAPLREEGVLLLGSGNSVHGRCTPEQAQAFDDHLQALAAEGSAALQRWAEHPAAAVCHARPEHLVPLLVCAGSAADARIESVRHRFMGDAASHFLFHG